jgi:hypothetical protein
VRRWIQAITLAKAVATSAQTDTAVVLAAVDGHPDLGTAKESDDTQQNPTPPTSGKHSPISQPFSATATTTPSDEKGWAQKNFENIIIRWARQYYVDSYPIGVTTSGEHGLGPDAFCRFLSAVSPESILRDQYDIVIWIRETVCDQSSAGWLGVFNEIAPMSMYLSLHHISEAFRVAADYIQSHPLHRTYLVVETHTASKLGRELTSLDKAAIEEAMKTKYVLDGHLAKPSRSMSMASAGLGGATNGSIEEYLGEESSVESEPPTVDTSDARRPPSISGLGGAINGSIEFYLDGDDGQLGTGNTEVPLIYRGGINLFSAATAASSTGAVVETCRDSVPTNRRRSQSDRTTTSAQRKYWRDSLIAAANNAALHTQTGSNARWQFRSL